MRSSYPGRGGGGLDDEIQSQIPNLKTPPPFYPPLGVNWGFMTATSVFFASEIVYWEETISKTLAFLFNRVYEYVHDCCRPSTNSVTVKIFIKMRFNLKCWKKLCQFLFCEGIKIYLSTKKWNNSFIHFYWYLSEVALFIKCSKWFCKKMIDLGNDCRTKESVVLFVMLVFVRRIQDSL